MKSSHSYKTHIIVMLYDNDLIKSHLEYKNPINNLIKSHFEYNNPIDADKYNKFIY